VIIFIYVHFVLFFMYISFSRLYMGKGKGAPEAFVAPVTPGRILIEAEGVPFEMAKEALRLAAQKLPVTTKFVIRRDYVQ